MKGVNVKSLEDRLMVATYSRYPITVVRGRGATVWDLEGRAYIDLMGGYGVALVGHCHPKVVEAVKRQAETLMVCHPTLYSEIRAELIEKLIRIAPSGLGRVYLCSSGAESVEAAIKMAGRFTGKRKLVSAMGGFHGKTLGALSVTWNPRYRKPFQHLLIDTVEFVPYGNLDRAVEAVDDETMAFIIEPIQGEGGVKVPPDDYLKGLKDLCEDRGALLIVDEVQTGLGRTGVMWACQRWGVKPDIMCVAKGLAGGIPIGATLAREDVALSLKRGEHTSTFGGNPVACAAASAVIDVLLEEGLPGRADRLGRLFKRELESLRQGHRVVRDVRGFGLMLGVELRFDVREVLLEALNRGIIMLYSGRNVLRFLPPLVIEGSQILEALKVLDETLTWFEARVKPKPK